MKLLFGFTAFEVQEVTCLVEGSLISRLSEFDCSLVIVTTELFIHSLFEFDDITPEMLEVKVLKSPTRPEVAGDEVVLAGELELCT